MSIKDYYSDEWIDKLFSILDICKLYKTDCDGDIVYIYEQKDSCI